MENIKDIHDITLEIKHNMFVKKSSKITIAPDALLIQPNKTFSKNIIRIPKENIQDFRYGVKWLSGFKFIIGREYQLFIRTKDNSEYSIRTKTFYGYKRDQLHSEFYTMVNHIWNIYFRKITNDYLTKYTQGINIQVCDVLITSDGINLESGSSFKRTRNFIKWDDLGSRIYHSNYSLYSKENAVEINNSFYFMADWNVSVLSGLIETILKMRNKTDS